MTRQKFVLGLMVAAWGCSSGGGTKAPPVIHCMTTTDCPRSPEWACGGGGLCACTPSGPEVCDGRDNDCDGVSDNGLKASGGNKAQYVVDGVDLPLKREDHSIDINGDGKVDNQLAAMVSVLKTNMVDAEMQVTTAIMQGTQILLFDVSSADAKFTTDACAGSTFYTGVEHPHPEFSGLGTFMAAPSPAPAAFLGTLAQKQFDSQAPASTATPVLFPLTVSLFGATPVVLPLQGAHVSFLPSTTRNGLDGEIHGAVRTEDVQSTLVPAFAAELTKTLTNGAGTPQAMQVSLLFDDGGVAQPGDNCGTACKNFDGTCAHANDNVISPCEVSTNGLVAGVLAPDVQMFDSDGKTYKPSAANLKPDSLSVGIGFHAIGAKF